MAHTQKKKKEKKKKETLLLKDRTIGLSRKDFKAAITNMSKELKETIHKELKEVY